MTDFPDGANRAMCLNKALEMVTGHREQDYGSPEDSFKVIAGFWQTFLTAHCLIPGAEGNPPRVYLRPEDVATMMSLFKIARLATGKATPDSYIDLAGYAACGYELAAEWRNESDLADADAAEQRHNQPTMDDEPANIIKDTFVDIQSTERLDNPIDHKVNPPSYQTKYPHYTDHVG